jgi:hypothetical protein
VAPEVEAAVHAQMTHPVMHKKAFIFHRMLNLEPSLSEQPSGWATQNMAKFGITQLFL